MKVILTGATGVVGTECIRLALSHPQITEVVTVSRRPVSIPENVSSETDKSKLKPIILKDFGSDYPEAVLEALKGADACIWNLALTPTRAKTVTTEEVKLICHDYALVGLKSISSVANADHPFRFIYTSGVVTERDQNKTLWFASDYRKMRGAVESALLAQDVQSGGKVEVQITKPGIIDHPARGMAERLLLTVIAPIGTFSLHVSEAAAAELDQAIHGFDGIDTLENSDMVKIGRNMLQKWGAERS